MTFTRRLVCEGPARPSVVMAGLVPAIHEFSFFGGGREARQVIVMGVDACEKQDVDGRDKPGHDGEGSGNGKAAAE